MPPFWIENRLKSRVHFWATRRDKGKGHPVDLQISFVDPGEKKVLQMPLFRLIRQIPVNDMGQHEEEDEVKNKLHLNNRISFFFIFF